MESTLIIYDNNGTIYFQGSGEIVEPVGLQFMKVIIPQGSTLQKIDTSTETHMPIFVEIQKSQIEVEVETLKADNEMMKAAIDDLIMNSGGGF